MLEQAIPDLNNLEQSIMNDFMILSSCRGFSENRMPAALKYSEIMFYFNDNYLKSCGFVTMWKDCIFSLDEVLISYAQTKLKKIN